LSLVTCHKPVTGYQRFVTDTAVLVIDMLNSYQHEDAEKLVPSVENIVKPIAELVAAAQKSDDVDIIYVNDNYGDFTANQDDLVRQALDGERPDLVEPIVPQPDMKFLQKVRHSAFYATSLAYLLNQLGTKRVILTGQVTEQCILYTALDAYVRHFQVVVPPDAVAHIDADLGKAALRMMEENMRAEVVPAEKCLG
jgi:nicotinamidase-related amidase